MVDQRLAPHHVAAVHTERLAQSGDQNVGLPARHLLGAAAASAKRSDPVRVVDDQHRVLGEPLVMGSHQRDESVERGMVAAHAEHTVGHDEDATDVVGQRAEHPIELRQIQMWVYLLPLRLCEPRRVDDAVVVQ